MNIPFEIKEMNEEKGTFVAYGSTFGNEDLGGDVVVKGAFTKSLKDNPASTVYMFYNHDSKEIIGEYTSIEEDDKGLLIKGRLFIENIQRAKETHFLMMKGLIKKFSIGYKTIKRGFEDGRRMLKELQLVEVSPVTFPMNTEADLLGVKSMNIDQDKIDEITTISGIDDVLKDAGFSKKAAEALISKVAGFKKISNGGEPHKKSDVGDPQSTEQKELEEARIKKDNQEKSDFGGLLDKLINENKG